MELGVAESFEGMIRLINPEVVRGWNIVIQYQIEGSGSWYIEILHGKGHVEAGEHKSPDLRVFTDTETWMSIVRREISGEMALISGKLRAEGNMEIIVQHDEIFDREAGASE
jgi:putative sterol carrier protein